MLLFMDHRKVCFSSPFVSSLSIFIFIFIYQLIENQSSTGPVQTKPKQLLEVPSGLEKGLCRALFGFCL